MNEETHKLGEVLRAAREARGVDLDRVERDTKIRARYLSALERGEYRELPGSVYTKGFLRNYGSYLGLDPDYLIDLYRLETSTAVIERPSAPAPPRPIARRSRALVVTPGAVVATLLTVLVALFVVYLAYEFITFARQPVLRIVEPAGDVASHPEPEYTIRGVTAPGSTVQIEGAIENPTVTADDEGAFTVTLRLQPGTNVITIVARDPTTGRDTNAELRTIQVVDEEPVATPPPTLALSSPEPGATVRGPLAIAGTAAPGAPVQVAAALTTPAPASFSVVTVAGDPVPVPEQPQAEPPAPVELAADQGGAFSGELNLPPGTWRLAISSPDVPEPIEVEVTIAGPEGLAGTLNVEGGPSYIEIDQDDEPVADIYGHVLAAGTSVELSANATIRIRAGNAAAVSVTLNGVELGSMGAQGAVVEWRVSRSP